MGWFNARRNTNTDDAERLREALLWMLQAWESQLPLNKRKRFQNLQQRLQEIPSPVGLMNELHMLVPHSTGGDLPTSVPPTSEETEVFGEALTALACAMREAALLDEGLSTAIETLTRSMPITPSRADAVRISKKAVELENQAGPIRARAMAERREISRIVDVIADALGKSSGSGDHLITGLEQLAENLSQKTDPQALRRIRQEALRHVQSLQTEAESLRIQLKRAQEESAALRQVVAQQMLAINLANEQARRDALTGLLNRGGFDETFTNAVRNCRRNRRPLSLLLLDVDHFKRVNDTWGHPVGDDVLRTIAERLQKTLRDEDLIARVGGEEFAVVLPYCAVDTAADIAERIRVDIERQSFTVKESVFRVTISIGLDGLVGNEDGPNLYNRVDKALYAAKQKGRNRVTIASDADG